MADDEKTVGNVVSNITVKALQEFDTDPVPQDERPGSAKSGKSGSPKGSKAGSRPTSAAGRPGSAAGSRRGSAGRQSGAGSPAVERPPSAGSTKDRPSSVQDRPASGGSAKGRPPSAGSPKDRPASGGSARDRPPSGGSARDRPPSAGSPKDRPASGGSARDRPPSGGSVKDRPLSVTGSRPSSGLHRPPSGRQPSAADTPDRPASATEQAARPGSAARPPSGRPASGRVSSGRPGSGRVTSAQKDEAGQQQVSMGGAGGGDDDGYDNPPPQEPPQQPPYQPQTELQPYTTDMMGQPGGGGGGGSDDEGESDDEEEDAEEEMDEVGSEESDGESEMVVLDPDHPLMQRFQAALKAHLDKQNEKATLELRELIEAVKNKKGLREDVGVELYGVQQELARHQMMLESNHDEFAKLLQARNQNEQELEDVRNMYRDKKMNVTGEQKKGAELQGEVENLALRILYMENAKDDVRSDIAVMRRAAEKAESEVAKAESEKQKQDLFVDRLVERVDKLREEISMYEAQQTAQSEETKAAREALTEANMEIEAINLEKKQLFQQWNSSLIGMRRRDEAHAAMMEALNQQKQRIQSLETEIDGYKKSIQKEQEQNEKLTLILNKTEVDIATVKKLQNICNAKHDALKTEYATYTRMLHETEQALNRATTDKTLRINEVNALRKQIEREYLEKVRLEDEILERMRSQLTLDKAAQYTDKLTGKLRNRTKDLEAQVAQVENEISHNTMNISHTKARSDRLQMFLNELDEEIAQKNDIISKSETEIIHRNAIIERKQGVIDQYNKKLEQMITKAGGVELGPLEIQINSLQKSIEAEQQEIAELQQMWLRDQTELVSLSRDKDSQSQSVETLKKQLTILSQKKLRIENEINREKLETSDIQRNIRNLQNDMLKLNMLLHEERGTQYELYQSNILMENDFVGSLKEAEHEAITMKERLDSMAEEKERLLNSLVEAERQIMLWEKKTQLARETRAAVDSDVGMGEIKAMKAEIHRMQVRYTQLKKQQERMIQEMEKAVSRRDTIVTRGDAQAKMNKKVVTKGTFQRQMGELRRKIKNTIQDANNCDGEIRELRDGQQDLSQQLEEKQITVQQLQGSADTLDGDLDRLVELKQKNLTDLLTKQQKSKYYQQLKDGKYTRLVKSDAGLESELSKQVDRMQTLNAIVDRLNQEYPHAQPALRRVSMSLSLRAATEN